ncbi:amidohydrolase family protein [Microbacterium sp. 2MCAF23]|uniref:amidohydrolase family protein n=1 Tax=Microbacterium sp. 2MCAF23 TaxID=3232985 RepID=UPI003F9C2001
MTATLIVGAEVFDAETGALRRGSVAVVDGRFVPVPDAVVDGWHVIDVHGAIVVPGLIDLHTHVFEGQDLGVPIDRIAPRSGVTTVVDAGSSGAHLLGAFRRSIADLRDVTVIPFLNVSSIGATSIMLAGELRGPYVDADVAVHAVESAPDLIAGIKVRASANVGGAFTDRALAIARDVADRVRKPLMVHLGPAPSSVTDILRILHHGDILTHAFTGWPGNTIVSDGDVIPEALAARERGVVFDLGHGMSGVGYDVVRAAVAAGFAPDTVSTDLHSYSAAEVVDLPSVMGVCVALGMSVPDVLRAVTATPARVLGIPRGTLRFGEVADLTVLRLGRGDGAIRADAFGGEVAEPVRFTPELTMRAGRIVFDVATSGENERKA